MAIDECIVERNENYVSIEETVRGGEISFLPFSRRKGNQWRPSFWKGEWEELGEKVREECEEMTKKFVIYVDGALTESPSVLVSTSGRTSYARDTTSQIKLRASRYNQILERSTS